MHTQQNIHKQTIQKTMSNKEMTPQQKSQQLLQAIQFCKQKKLITAEEIAKAKSNQQKFQLACEAVMRMELYLKAHPQK